jgi:hypothetical protein
MQRSKLRRLGPLSAAVPSRIAKQPTGIRGPWYVQQNPGNAGERPGAYQNKAYDWRVSIGQMSKKSAVLGEGHSKPSRSDA